MTSAATPMHGGNWRVCIVGGGIAGLSAAYHLSGAGASVRLFEASDQLGGLGTFFPFDGRHFERFYHCVLPTDADLLCIMRALGVEERVYWKPSRFAHHTGGRLYPLNTPLDLLRFAALPLSDRLRLGWTGLYAGLVSARGLDGVTTTEWLAAHCGARAFETFFRPMLEAKFGTYADRVPALWFWTRFNREKGTKREVKGYMRGGYKGLTDRLAACLAERGVELRLGAPVRALDTTASGTPLVATERGTFECDQLILTTPPRLAARMLDAGRLAGLLPPTASALEYVGVVNVVVFLRRRLTDFYWIATPDTHVPFQGIVETTNLIDLADTGGWHVVHLLRYVHRDDPLFARSECDVRDEFLAGLRRLFPDGVPAATEAFVFKAPFVEPVFPTDHLRHQPPDVLLPGRIYLATTAQVYPTVTSWNGTCGLTRRVTERMIADRMAA